jgi:hypothetical protein
MGQHYKQFKANNEEISVESRGNRKHDPESKAAKKEASNYQSEESE